MKNTTEKNFKNQDSINFNVDVFQAVEIFHESIKHILTTSKISITKRLEKLLPQIEMLLNEGVTHDAILKHLNANGFNLSITSYKTMLKRIRKRLNSKTKSKPANAKEMETERALQTQSHQHVKASVNKKLQWDPHKEIDW